MRDIQCFGALRSPRRGRRQPVPERWTYLWASSVPSSGPGTDCLDTSFSSFLVCNVKFSVPDIDGSAEQLDGQTVKGPKTP
jgi:hypothetical protein